MLANATIVGIRAEDCRRPAGWGGCGETFVTLCNVIISDSLKRLCDSVITLCDEYRELLHGRGAILGAARPTINFQTNFTSDGLTNLNSWQFSPLLIVIELIPVVLKVWHWLSSMSSSQVPPSPGSSQALGPDMLNSVAVVRVWI